MNYVREYWRKIESGEIVTSRRVINKDLFKESERILKILCSILLGDEILEKHSDDFSGFIYHILMENLYNITN